MSSAPSRCSRPRGTPRSLRRFVQISTDEVYGSVPEGASKETDELRPRNPYSASKAGADRLAYSYWATYQVPVIVTRASNNYGPYQFPEKVIPLFITNALEDRALPLYGDGLNVRDWLHVEDHCSAIDLLIERGAGGEVYNIGGGNEVTNIELTRRILALAGKPDTLIEPVADRLGHDRRYALDTAKLRALGWLPRHAFADGLAATVEWYRANPWWWQPIKHQDQAFRAYYKAQYRQSPCEVMADRVLERVLVTGSKGQLGAAFMARLAADAQVSGIDVDDVDLADAVLLRECRADAAGRPRSSTAQRSPTWTALNPGRSRRTASTPRRSGVSPGSRESSMRSWCTTARNSSSTASSTGRTRSDDDTCAAVRLRHDETGRRAIRAGVRSAQLRR